MTFLLLNATGKIGSEAVRQLITKGYRPRLGVRDKKKARHLFGDDVDLVPFDFGNPAVFPEIFHGITRFFFVAAHPRPVPSVQALLRAAGEAGVKHVVFSSGRTTGDVAWRPLFEVEQLVRNCGLEWTILRPGWFMQNFIDWLGDTIRKDGKLYLPAADAKTAFIDVRDISAVVTRLFIEGDRHNGQTYELTSDEAFDHFQVMEMIGNASGRKMEYMPLSPEAFVERMLQEGWTREEAEYTADLYSFVRQGKEAAISHDVELILGRQPRRFAQFVNDYRQEWMGST